MRKWNFSIQAIQLKDRMAVKMVEEAEKSGQLKPGGTLIEGTSGNTGMGLALTAIIKGYRCIFTTTDKQSQEKIDILRALGAEVIVCPTNVTPDDPKSYYSVARRLAKEIPNSIYVNQYDNLANSQAHYEQTGPEIWEQTDGKITHLVVGSGTGGTVSGTGKFLKEKNPDIRIWAIDSYGSLLKKYFDTGKIDMSEVYPYITEGIGEDFVPANYNMEVIDHFEKVTDKEGAIMARRIAKEEGIFVGYSAGSAVQGLMQLRDQLKSGDMVVVIFHDHGSRYVGKIYNDEWMLERGFLHVHSVKDVVNARKGVPLVTLQPDDKVTEAVARMKKFDIEHIPVMQNGEPVGAISEGMLFGKIIDNPEIKDASVKEVMHKPFPLVDEDTPIERLSAYINKDNGAVLTQNESGQYHIVTKYDILQSLANA
jgi:cystathionine beta-synthase